MPTVSDIRDEALDSPYLTANERRAADHLTDDEWRELHSHIPQLEDVLFDGGLDAPPDDLAALVCSILGDAESMPNVRSELNEHALQQHGAIGLVEAWAWALALASKTG